MHPQENPLDAKVREIDLHRFGARIGYLLFSHLRIFGVWSMLNLIAGFILIDRTSGAVYYFQMMNLSWGIANSFVALLFYLHVRRMEFKKGDLDDHLKIQRHICDILAINCALDIVYAMTGCFFLFSAKSANWQLDPMQTGFGFSLLMQGTFLLVQDFAFYTRHRRAGR